MGCGEAIRGRTMRYQQTFLFSLEEAAGPVSAAAARKAAGRVAAQQRQQPAPSKRQPVSTTGQSRPAADANDAVISPSEPASQLDSLRQQLRRMESRRSADEAAERVTFSTGGSVLDALLPHGGLRPGTLVEWVCDARRSGAMLLAMIAAAKVLAHPASAARPLVIADGLGGDIGSAQESFYPPAAVALGIPSDRMVIFRKQSGHTRSDFVWAIDQALRSGAVAAVFAEIGDWLDPADARRLQLAAEIGGAIGLLVRPTRTAAASSSSRIAPPAGPMAGKTAGMKRPTPTAKTSASFADIRWLVSPLPGHGGRRLQVELARCRGGIAGGSRLIEIDSRPDLPVTGAGVRDRVVAVRSGGANDAAAAMASGLVEQLADPAAAVRRSDRRPARRHAS
jgi:protein ImuA